MFLLSLNFEINFDYAIILNSITKEKNLRIGIDFDGVFTDLYSFMDSECEKFANENGFNCIRNNDGTNCKEMFGWTDKEDEFFWDSCLFKYAKSAIMKPMASEIIKKLKKDGHTIVIVTSRHFCKNNDSKGQQSRDILIKWLLDNNIYYDELYFTDDKMGKVPQIKESKIDIFIDDSIRNLQEIANVIPVICMTEPYNRMFKHKNMIRCETWKDVYKVISEKSKTN